MGVLIEMCSCSQQAIMSNSKSIIENEGVNLCNTNNNNAKNDNNIEQEVKKRKKISNGTKINNEQSNDTETYNKVSSNGVAIFTPKQKRESQCSQKSKKKEKEKNRRGSNKKNKIKSKKESNEEESENIDVSDTVLSELIITEKLKTIPKEKKKIIRGRNIVNIIILGYNEVGKSSFCIRLVENKFEDFYIPSICDENFCKVQVYNDHNYKVNFSVILGGTKIQKQENLFNNGDFFLLIYDITKIRSFNQINVYLNQIRKFLFLYDKEGKCQNFCLAGNKSDLEGERKIGGDFINKCIQKYNIKHFDISIKTGKNINNVILSFIQIFDRIAFSNK